MKKKTLVQLRHIADRIPKQCPCDIAAFLYSICEEWDAANHYLWDIKNRQYTLYPL